MIRPDQILSQDAVIFEFATHDAFVLEWLAWLRGRGRAQSSSWSQCTRKAKGGYHEPRSSRRKEAHFSQSLLTSFHEPFDG